MRFNESVGVKWNELNRNTIPLGIIIGAVNTRQRAKLPSTKKAAVIDFYNKDGISKVLPYKKRTVSVKDWNC